MLERGDELAALRGVLGGGSRRLLRFGASPLARDRSPEERRRYREARFEAHLAHAGTRELPRSLLIVTTWSPGAADPVG